MIHSDEFGVGLIGIFYVKLIHRECVLDKTVHTITEHKQYHVVEKLHGISIDGEV